MSALTEEQVEHRVERMTDHLDHCLMGGSMSQKDYDHAMKELAQWADAAYQRAEIWDRARRRFS